ncbi:mechanosensitive ion channel family protein|uniref:Mechanosensitive ion channel n=1 Tax=Dendrosporobacter quercicolus TaxID=146817 RepID=A0A1G9TJZ6_9FIRM|nr:mechanosensitive ion channel family protein [Dendrosporobacter quercicolus]NSL48937.1 mechanosensitive ion channel family protein [Dendrosporobacter quercicolus DSM 1736]SDM47983.1 Mechanosensitive ion channel [Dendrosporobacter quercicolus]
MAESVLLTQIGRALAIILAAVLIGYAVERYLLTKLKQLADATKWECDEVIVCALRGRLIKWLFIAGLYSVVLVTPLPYNITGISKSVLIVIFVLSVTAAAAHIAVGVINVYAKKSRRAFPSTSIFTNLTISLLVIIGALIIMQSLGISITPLLTALGVGGLAVALALQDTLSNFFAGLHILFSRPIRPSDYIRLDTGEEGYVIDITWRNTSIRDLTENMIVVPNSKMATAKIINFSLPTKSLIILMPIGVSYNSDLEQVERITAETAREVMAEVPGGMPDYEPVVRFNSFGEYSVQYNVLMCVQEFAAQYLVKHEFIKRLHRNYRMAGIKVPYPVQTVYLRKE